MISFPANTDIFVVHTPVSFACGIDGMVRYCRLILQQEPLSRAYFIFINKRKEQLRALWFDGQGFLLCTKRLSKGRFKYWPIDNEKCYSQFQFFDAQILFSGGDFLTAKSEKIWKKIA
jgi:transposase